MKVSSLEVLLFKEEIGELVVLSRVRVSRLKAFFLILALFLSFPYIALCVFEIQSERFLEFSLFSLTFSFVFLCFFVLFKIKKMPNPVTVLAFNIKDGLRCGDIWVPIRKVKFVMVKRILHRECYTLKVSLFLLNGEEIEIFDFGEFFPNLSPLTKFCQKYNIELRRGKQRGKAEGVCP